MLTLLPLPPPLQITDINSFIDAHSYEKVSAIRHKAIGGGGGGSGNKVNTKKQLPSIGSKEHLAKLLDQGKCECHQWIIK